MLGNFHQNMAGALLISETAAHRRRTHALPTRPFIHEAARHKQFVHVQRLAGIFRLAFGVGDGAAQRLLNILGHALLRELQRVQRFFRAPSANQVYHQPRLLRRNARVTRLGDSLNLRCLACRFLNCRCHRYMPFKTSLPALLHLLVLLRPLARLRMLRPSREPLSPRAL